MSKKINNFKLSIVIPRYSESFELLRETLYSIQNQVGYNLADVEVVVVDDSCGLYPLQLPDDEFTFKIQQLEMMSNGGPGATREYGTKKANGEWIYYLDADDLLAPNALYSFEQVLVARNNQLDLIQFGGEAVGFDTNLNRYMVQPHFSTTVWCFGTFVRKSVLHKLNIHWHSRIISNEEQIFMNKLFMLADPQRIHVFNNQPPLIYYWRQTSSNTITRINNGEYGYTCIPEHSAGRYIVLKTMLQYGKHAEAVQMAVGTIIHGYAATQQSILNDHQEWIDNIDAIMGVIIREFAEKIDSIPSTDLNRMVNQQLGIIDQPLRETWADWYNRVRELPEPEYVLQPIEKFDKSQNNGEWEPEYGKIEWNKIKPE